MPMLNYPKNAKQNLNESFVFGKNINKVLKAATDKGLSAFTHTLK